MMCCTEDVTESIICEKPALLQTAAAGSEILFFFFFGAVFVVCNQEELQAEVDSNHTCLSLKYGI